MKSLLFPWYISWPHLRSLRKITSAYWKPREAYMWLRGFLKILNMFCIGQRRNVLVQFAGPALKIFLFFPTIFIRSRKASTNAIECNQLLFSTCNMLSIYWQSFPPSHYFSAWVQMTSTRWVLMYSIVALASYIFRVVFMKSYMDFGLRLTK